MKPNGPFSFSGILAAGLAILASAAAAVVGWGYALRERWSDAVHRAVVIAFPLHRRPEHQVPRFVRESYAPTRHRVAQFAARREARTNGVLTRSSAGGAPGLALAAAV